MNAASFKNPNLLVGGKSLGYRLSKPTLYPTASPWKYVTGAPSTVPIVIMGKDPAVGNTLVDVWPLNFNRTLPTVGFTLGISSSSANDTAASGTGAQYIEVDVLDVNYKAYSITLALNGQTLVSDTTLPGQVLRVNDMRIVGVGTSLASVGAIYAFDNSDTLVAGVPQTQAKQFCIIAIGYGSSTQMMYTVPAGYNLQLEQYVVTVTDLTTAGRQGYRSLQFSRPALGGNVFESLEVGLSSLNGIVTFDPGFLLNIGEKQDIRMRFAFNATSSVVAQYNGVLYPI